MKINKKSILFISIILCFTFMCMCLSACTWEDFKNKAKDVWDNLVAVDDNGNDMLNGETYEMPSAMTFRSSAPNTTKSVTLTATIEPSTAANKNLDWSVAWKNANSTWATGKTVTSYVTVTPASDGASTATVKFLADFGEQIVLTVKSRVNAYASATCTIDCWQAASFNCFNYEVTTDTVNYMWSFGENESDIRFLGRLSEEVCSREDIRCHSNANANNRDTVSLNKSQTYTKAVSLSDISVYVRLSDALVTEIKKDDALYSYFRDVANNGNFATKQVFRTSFYTSATDSDYISYIDIYEEMFCGLLTSYTGQAPIIIQLCNKLQTALQAVSGDHFIMTVNSTFSSGYTESVSFGMRFSDSSIGLVAESVSLSSTALNF